MPIDLDALRAKDQLRAIATQIVSEWDGRPETKDRDIPVLKPFLIDRIVVAMLKLLKEK